MPPSTVRFARHLGAGRGLAWLPISIEDYRPASVAGCRLKGDQPTVGLVIGYRKTNASPILERFLSRIDNLTWKAAQ
jgi:LysR family transcriptional regulator, hca operon transcriptional activator